jgi:hypothetical protein
MGMGSGSGGGGLGVVRAVHLRVVQRAAPTALYAKCTREPLRGWLLLLAAGFALAALDGFVLRSPWMALPTADASADAGAADASAAARTAWAEAEAAAGAAGSEDTPFSTAAEAYFTAARLYVGAFASETVGERLLGSDGRLARAQLHAREVAEARAAAAFALASCQLALGVLALALALCEDPIALLLGGQAFVLWALVQLPPALHDLLAAASDSAASASPASASAASSSSSGWTPLWRVLMLACVVVVTEACSLRPELLRVAPGLARAATRRLASLPGLAEATAEATKGAVAGSAKSAQSALRSTYASTKSLVVDSYRNRASIAAAAKAATTRGLESARATVAETAANPSEVAVATLRMLQRHGSSSIDTLRRHSSNVSAASAASAASVHRQASALQRQASALVDELRGGTTSAVSRLAGVPHVRVMPPDSTFDRHDEAYKYLRRKQPTMTRL